MKNTITTLENLHSDYVNKFEHKRYLSLFSLRCYHRRNVKGNKIYRYTLVHSHANETKEMTRLEMIKALKNSIDNNQPLLKIGV